MKPLNKLDIVNARSEVIKLKKKFGMLYGMIAGLAFAVTSWGWDGYSMSRAHGYLPWTMLITGAIFCTIAGGIVGWLTSRLESSLLGLVFWVISSAFFAWIMVVLPLQINPFIVSKLNPQLGALLNYEKGAELAFRFTVALFWVAPFMMIIGVTQVPMSEPAVFSTSIFGRIAPFLFCIVVMGISGTITDSLITAHFRSAVTALDSTIQFVVDNKNNENTNNALSRELHAGALNSVKEYVQESRHLYVRSYDETLGDLHILVMFDQQLIDCEVLYSQPNFCKVVTGK